MEDWQIKKATTADLDAVEALYGAVCDHLATLAQNPCGWQRGVYPTRATGEQWLQEDCLYLLWAHGVLAASLALSHQPEPGYEHASWQIAAPPDSITVLHTVTTHPAWLGRGYAGKLLQFAERTARQTGQAAIRLDVCACNAPAIALYEKAGYRCVEERDLFGLAPPYHLYRLYELVL